MADLYTILTAEMTNDPLNIGYKTNNQWLSDDEIFRLLTVRNRTKVISRFGSFRTLAGLLTDIEYATMKGTLSALSAASEKVADMLKMLNLPGDDSGNGGGIDFGDSQVRGLADAIFNVETANKLKTYAEVLISRAEELDISELGIGHITSAKTLII